MLADQSPPRVYLSGMLPARSGLYRVDTVALVFPALTGLSIMALAGWSKSGYPSAEPEDRSPNKSPRRIMRSFCATSGGGGGGLSFSEKQLHRFEDFLSVKL